MKRNAIWAAIVLVAVAACGKQAAGPVAGTKTEALDGSAWDVSQWISAVDAPVQTGPAGEVYRAADGASWFVSTVVNEGKVVSARWMTAGLGVYELYLNVLCGRVMSTK